MDTCSPFLSPIVELMESDVPMLKSHDDTNGASDPSYSPLVWKMSGLVKSPRLQKIHCKQIRDNITDFSFMWAQLTDIKLSDVSYGWKPANMSGTLLDLVLILSLSPLSGQLLL